VVSISLRDKTILFKCTTHMLEINKRRFSSLDNFFYEAVDKYDVNTSPAYMAVTGCLYVETLW
jgi:hypothetical protein